MSRVATSTDFRYPWYMKAIFRVLRRRYGADVEPVLLWARIPGAFLAMSALYRTLDRKSSGIDPGLRSLVQVKVSQINRCAFCIDLNSATALERHSGQEKLAALADYRASPLFSDRERAALAYAEAESDTAVGVDDELFSRVRRHFSEQQVVELTALIAFQNMSSKFNAALDVPAGGYCRVSVHASDPVSSEGRREES